MLSLFVVSLTVILVSDFSRAEVPVAFDKNQIESNVLKKFISLRSEKSEFYRITDIQTNLIEDNTFHKPGYEIKISYETPTCKNNYFRGVAFSVACLDDECPFGMIYKECF
jgi:hypothetical protein